MAGLVDIQLWQIILTICNTIILFLVLRWKLFTPVKEFMDNRAKEIETSIANAEQMKKDASDILESYQTKIAEAQTHGREIIEDARKTAQKRADEIIQNASDESAKIKEKAFKDIEMEKEKAIRSIKGEVADMTVLATEKLINKSIDTETSKKLIDEVINEIGDEKWSS